VNLPDTDWSQQPQTLILVLESTCRYCNESAPFYRKLVQEVQEKNTKLIAVLPSKVEESKPHLDGLGLSSIEVRQAPLDTLQISGTPTLILTNDKGEVTNFWIGKLSTDRELDVLNKL
jgi:thioredoxin-related protein